MCGIIAWNGDKDKFPNIDYIKLLMLANGKRGQDATGICLNNHIHKTTDDVLSYLAKYSDTVFKLDNLKNSLFLGHTRSASNKANASNVELAHPMQAASEKNKNNIVLVMNGTVTNISDLCYKYSDVAHNYSLSDTWHLVRMMASLEGEDMFDIFKYYEGAFTCIFYPSNFKNVMYVHRDKDRELFYWQKDKNEMYVSSIKDSLMMIGGTEKTVFEFQPGKVYKVYKGAITKEWEITRSPYHKPYTTYNSSRNTSSYPPARSHNVFAAKTPRPELARSLELEEANMLIPQLIGSPANPNKNILYWHNHLYYRNGHPCTGIVVANVKTGEISDGNNIPTGVDLKDNEVFFLVEGVRAKDRQSYEILYDIGIGYQNNGFKSNMFKDNFKPYNHKEFLYYPHVSSTQHPRMLWYNGNAIAEGARASSHKHYVYSPVLSNITFIVDNNGFIQKVVENSCFTKVEELFTDDGKIKFSAGKKTTNVFNVKSKLKTVEIDFQDEDGYGLVDEEPVRDKSFNLEKSLSHDRCTAYFKEFLFDCPTEENIEDGFKSFCKNYTVDSNQHNRSEFALQVLLEMKERDKLNSDGIENIIRVQKSLTNFFSKEVSEFWTDLITNLNTRNVQDAIAIEIENNWLAKNPSFVSEVQNKTDLQELMISYCDTDEDFSLKPFYHAIVLILHSQGYIQSYPAWKLLENFDSNTKIAIKYLYQDYVKGVKYKNLQVC